MIILVLKGNPHQAITTCAHRNLPILSIEASAEHDETVVHVALDYLAYVQEWYWATEEYWDVQTQTLCVNAGSLLCYSAIEIEPLES